MPHRQYIRRETAISIVINSVMSAVFYFIVFGGLPRVPLWGTGNWVFDFVPQSFMIALMSTLVPGALAARGVRQGRIDPAGKPGRLPASLLARALVMAVAAALAGTLAMAVMVLLSGAADLAATPALVLKVLYGASLASIITPIGLRRALALPGLVANRAR